MEKRKKSNDYDLEMIRRYRALPAREKLKWLEQANLFFMTATPAKKKAAWKILRLRGW